VSDTGLRVTVLELPASSGEPGRALELVDRALGAGPSTDLVLLPEQSFVGYVSPRGDFDLERYAEPIDGPTARACARLARLYRVHLVSPLVLRDGDACFNAMLAHAPDGSRLFHYEKRHPWIPETWATPGRTPPPIVTIQNVRVTIAICYDGHFLSEDAADVLRRADLLLFPSAWVDRYDSRTPLLVDVARRFDVAVANANWGPGIVRVPGQGGSFILDRDGTRIASVTPDALRADAVVCGTSDAPR
jgi:5-aminopentanamidase